MDQLVIACGVCGTDPATDTMLVQTGIAAVIAAPWWFRHRIAGAIRRIGGSSNSPDAASCDAPPTDSRQDDPES
jgi:hypothetical protein